MSRWINRAALIVRPKKPYLDWAAGTDAEASDHVKDFEKRVSIYLVAEDPRGQKETAPIKNYFEEIFEAELAAWWQDEEQWPKPRTLKIFREWFDVVGESVVTDLELDPIEVEDAE